MAAKSGGDLLVGGCGGVSGHGNSAASRRASSQPSGSGQPTLAAAALFKYSCTVLTETEQLRAICRWSSFSSFRSRKTSLILRMDFLLAGNRFSLLKGSTARVDVQRRLPVEIIPGASRTAFRDRPKSVRLAPGIRVRLQPGIVFGISPESCSASARNSVRLAPESAAFSES